MNMSRIPKKTKTIAIPYQINEELNTGKILSTFPAESFEPMVWYNRVINPIIKPKINKIIPTIGSTPLFWLLPMFQVISALFRFKFLPIVRCNFTLTHATWPLRLVAGRVRFELTTSSLEGWLAIRAATSAQTKLENKDRRLRFKVSYDGFTYLRKIGSYGFSVGNQFPSKTLFRWLKS